MYRDSVACSNVFFPHCMHSSSVTQHFIDGLRKSLSLNNVLLIIKDVNEDNGNIIKCFYLSLGEKESFSP